MSTHPLSPITHLTNIILNIYRLEDDSIIDMNNGFGLLIPLKLDLDLDGKKVKEHFLWDKNEPYLTLESFAKILMEEHNLP